MISPLTSFLPDWVAVRAKCQQEPWAQAVVQQLDTEFQSWKGVLAIPSPERQSHRYHTYFCDNDGEKLRFDPASPERHVCPRCGKSYSGQPWDGAWVMQMHNSAICQMERAAILMHLLDGPQAEIAEVEFKRVASYYIQHYKDHEPHGDRPPMVGRVQPHGLNEAVWLATFFRTIRWSGVMTRWSPSELEALHDMARIAVDLVKPQIHSIHNHDGWKLAAMAECAAVLGDGALRNWCRDSENGMAAQLAKGFNADGYWFESSVTYHYYMLEAVFAYWDAMGEEACLGDEDRRKLVLAINNPARLAYRDGRMPAYADGWIATKLVSFAHEAELAWGRLGQEIDVAAYYCNEQPRSLRLMCAADSPLHGEPVKHRGSVSALLFGPQSIGEKLDVKESSFVLKASGIAVLRNDHVRIGIRFGPDGGAHDHRDKLNVDVEMRAGWRSLDLGTSGYSSKFTQWLRSPQAHNLIVVDGQPQSPHAGELVEFSEDRIVARSAFEQTRFQREIRLTENGWTDDYSVQLDQPKQVDWNFHGDGLFLPEADGIETELKIVGEGYPWLRKVRRIADVETLRGVWKWKESSVALTLPIPSGFTVYVAEAPGNAEDRPLGVVIVHGLATEVVFRAAFVAGGA